MSELVKGLQLHISLTYIQRAKTAVLTILQAIQALGKLSVHPPRN
jgi:hypothetical protein